MVNIPNSMTVLPELVPVAIEMSKRKLTGNMNYTNPGAISHNEILELYKEYIDPDFTWDNFTIEEQVRGLPWLFFFVDYCRGTSPGSMLGSILTIPPHFLC